MYSLQWALVVTYVLAGPIVAFLLVLGAIPVVMFGLFTHKYRRGVTANRITLGLLIAAGLLSLVMWYELATGLINGEPIDYTDSDISTYKIIAGFQAFVLVTYILSTTLRRVRRGE
jgi:hypothetical protein